MLTMLTTLSGGAGESEKFTEIYRRYHRALCGLAFSILKEQQAAEDAVHNAFLCILKNLDKIVQIDCSKTRAFLIVITRRECYKIYNDRRDNGAVGLEEYRADTGGAVWEDIERNADSETLKAALSTLSELDRQLLIGKYAYGYSYKELAGLLGLSEKNVSVRIMRAKQKVIQFLERGEDE